MALQIGLADAEAVDVAIGRFFHHVVGYDAPGLDGAAVGRVVAGCGELDGRLLAGQRQDGLHGALAEGLRAQHDGTLVVLQGASHDLGGRGRTRVDQHHHLGSLGPGRQRGDAVGLAAARHVVLRAGVEAALGVVGAAVGGGDFHAGLQEGGRDADGAVQQAARVIAQVQHHGLERAVVLLGQLFEVIDQVVDGVFLELRDADVAHARFQQLAAYRLHLDDVTHDGEHDGLGHALALQRQGDGALGLAAHHLDGFFQPHVLGGGVADLDDQVTGLDAGLGRRGALDGRDHLDEAVLGADLDAQAAELALGVDLQLLEGVLVQIGRVRIQPGEHAADGVGDQLVVLDGLDVVGLDGAEDFAELAKLVQRKDVAAGVAAFGQCGKAQAERNAGDGTDADEAGRSEIGHEGWDPFGRQCCRNAAGHPAEASRRVGKNGQTGQARAACSSPVGRKGWTQEGLGLSPKRRR